MKTNGLGLFVPKNLTPQGISLSYDNFIKIVDMDGDSDMDLFAILYDKLVWFENLNGQGDFGTAQITNLNQSLVGAYGGDFDNDGDLDFVGIENSPNYDLVWRENTGQGNFGAAQTISTTINPNSSSLNVSDMDSDGDLDILCNDNQNVVWFENTNGQGNFGSSQTLIVLNNQGSIFAVYPTDIDGDGDQDFLTSTEGGGVVWHENTGQLTFGTPQNIEPNTIGAGSVHASDLDGDSDLDVISGFLNELVWYENTNGQGSFSTKKTIDNNNNGGVFTILAKDIDGDGNKDIVSSWSYGIFWYENLGVLGNTINGTVRMDQNANGCGTSDMPIPNIMVTTDNGANSFSTFTQANGSYSLPTNAGNFTTTIGSSFPSYFTVNPTSHTSNFSNLGNSDVADFCVQASGNINDVNIVLYSLGIAIPGVDVDYQLVYRNMGTTVMNGSMNLSFDGSKISFVSASETVASQTSNSLTFNYTGLNPFETRTIDLTFHVAAPPTTNIGDTLSFTATINPVTGDYTQNDNTIAFDQNVYGSFDPNDIRVLEGDEIYLSETDEFLHYIIRFQNVGTYYATNVKVVNMLDPKLDWTTLQIENMSHSGKVIIEDGTKVKFVFENIYLPSSGVDSTGSHGFIQYKIKPANGIVVGNTIPNDAKIYFDFNPPISTNTVTTTVVQNLSVEENNIHNLAVYPNPSSGILNLVGNTKVTGIKIFSETGRQILSVQNEEGIKTINIQKLSHGLYFIKLRGINGYSVVKKVLKF